MRWQGARARSFGEKGQGRWVNMGQKVKGYG